MKKCSICFYYSPSPRLCCVMLNYVQQASDKGDKTIGLPFELDWVCCKQSDGLTLMGLGFFSPPLTSCKHPEVFLHMAQLLNLNFKQDPFMWQLLLEWWCGEGEEALKCQVVLRKGTEREVNQGCRCFLRPTIAKICQQRQMSTVWACVFLLPRCSLLERI